MLWAPSPAVIEPARITAYQRWLAAERGVSTTGYSELWDWSVREPGPFWDSVWDYFGVLGERGTGPAVTGQLPDATWFAEATLNYARNALRAARTDPGRTAVIARAEDGTQRTLSYGELAAEVARVREALRSLGVGQGDRVAAFLPNIPEALVGLLAAASLGAIWSSCSPDFGAGSVIDRFAQIAPKVLFAVAGYSYGGKTFPRAEAVAEIVGGLPSLSALVLVGDHPDRSAVPQAVGRAAWKCCTGTSLPPAARAARSSPRCRSATRSGCCTPPAPPGCPRRSCTATAASCWSTSRRSRCTRTSARAMCSSGTPPPAG